MPDDVNVLVDQSRNVTVNPPTAAPAPPPATHSPTPSLTAPPTKQSVTTKVTAEPPAPEDPMAPPTPAPVLPPNTNHTSAPPPEPTPIRDGGTEDKISPTLGPTTPPVPSTTESISSTFISTEFDPGSDRNTTPNTSLSSTVGPGITTKMSKINTTQYVSIPPDTAIIAVTVALSSLLVIIFIIIILYMLRSALPLPHSLPHVMLLPKRKQGENRYVNICPGCWTYGTSVFCRGHDGAGGYTVASSAFSRWGMYLEKPQRLVTLVPFHQLADFGVPFTPIGMLSSLKRLKHATHYGAHSGALQSRTLDQSTHLTDAIHIDTLQLPALLTLSCNCINEFNRVIIPVKRGEENTDYVNASFIDEKNLVAVRQFHFHSKTPAPLAIGWDPTDAKDDNIIAAVQTAQQSGNHPITVHCSSAGAGRTGTFCALSTVLERVKAEGILDVFQTVKSLRLQRPHMVQTLEQYEFCYKVVQEYIDAFSDYANFK
ncbi:Receptor-type tyrosine-protein phosphatase alpha [Bagarius yarrelli]|uniref:protein-tyrosine-phosphatase n=1 Tax=Bagarius yarrelli TaxID=175774 RepID=A0A556TUA2_BAGYA|nr:Receptor-type tyrosine-protein phosphatase alpha [Bagarius yarrelli]